MSGIIELLPDSVANQIAAGEVVQRPASVIKELMENAIDAAATSISVVIKDAGRTLIQISDNGTGMNESDARKSFERHATSKIRKTDDLFCIRTMGFRGEALASIAAVAGVTLHTRRNDTETGTQVIINGYEFLGQEPVSCPVGSTFYVRNLFYNVPARRKFLKSDSTELRHILTEFQRIVLAHPTVAFSITHNNIPLYTLYPGNLRQRITDVMGNTLKPHLIEVRTETQLVKISGFTGKPDIARKTPGDQYFFVNNRYMRHPMLHRALVEAYDRILPTETIPVYVLFFEVDPSTIDVNIHPTKTEIKFENEQAVRQILFASIKESLGKFNVVPSIDFEVDASSVDLPAFRSNNSIQLPTIDINPHYNPFDDGEQASRPSGGSFRTTSATGWEELYRGFESEKKLSNEWVAPPLEQQSLTFNESPHDANYFQLKNKYVLTNVKSGVMIIDQKRAHERILFERYLKTIAQTRVVAQQSLFPQTVELTPEETSLLADWKDEIAHFGFDLRATGENTVEIHAYPTEAEQADPGMLIKELLQTLNHSTGNAIEALREQMAASLAKATAIPYGKKLGLVEMSEMVDQLFACSNPNFSPDGKSVVSIMYLDEIEKRFLK